MKGAHVLIQNRRVVDKASWQKSRPQVFTAKVERSDRGKPPVIGDDGRIAHAIEGESMEVVDVSRGKTSTQEMSGFGKDRWSGGKQLFWSGATPRARLTLEFEIKEAGDYEVGAVLTTARDYAIINVQLDGMALGTSLDLYDYPDVRTTGIVQWGTRSLSAGKHRLMLETTGANESAIQSHMVGLDCLILVEK